MFSFSNNFWRLCGSMFFFTISFNLIIPELNSFISNLGGAELKGIVIGLFTISAGISRPFSGKLADHIGRRKVMVIGIIVAACVCLLYPLCFSVWFFLLLRFLHGFSNGFYPTGATHDARERGADDDTDRQIDDVAAQDELLEAA